MSKKGLMTNLLCLRQNFHNKITAAQYPLIEFKTRYVFNPDISQAAIAAPDLTVFGIFEDDIILAFSLKTMRYIPSIKIKNHLLISTIIDLFLNT